MWIVSQIIFALSGWAIFPFLYKAIQVGQMFGSWQKVLEKLYGAGWFNLSKFLGDCMICFAHCVAWLILAMNILCTYKIWGISGDLWGCVANYFYGVLFITATWRVNILAQQDFERRADNSNDNTE